MSNFDELANILNGFVGHYNGLITLTGSLFGIMGVLFGFWRYSKESSAKRRLAKSQEELDRARERLKNLENYANGLNQYSKVI
jgi:uncharacterized membrane protein YqjE